MRSRMEAFGDDRRGRRNLLPTTSNSSFSKPVGPCWNDVFLENKACPRYISFSVNAHSGMGDMLFAMCVALAIAVVTKTQLAVPDSWGVFSFHMLKNFKARAPLGEPKGGYQSVYYDLLGLPPLKKFNRQKWERQGYKIFNSPFEYFFYRPQKFNDFVPCKSVVMIESMSCNNHTEYCLLKHGHVVYDTVMPLLRLAWKYSKDMCRTAPLSSLGLGLTEQKVNIVWHMRVGDLCLKCDSVDYYVKIFKFIELSLNGTVYENIFMFQNPEGFNTSGLLSAIPNSRLFTSIQIEDAVCLILRTDILVSTGSSFPNAVSLFSPAQRPIIFAEVSKEWAMAGPNPRGFWSPWYFNHQTAIRMINATVQYYKPKYVHEIMEFTGLLERVNSNSTKISRGSNSSSLYAVQGGRAGRLGLGSGLNRNGTRRAGGGIHRNSTGLQGGAAHSRNISASSGGSGGGHGRHRVAAGHQQASTTINARV